MSPDSTELFDPDRWILARSAVWFLQCAVVYSVVLVGFEALDRPSLETGVAAAGVFLGAYLLFRQVDAFVERRLQQRRASDE